MEGLSPRVRVVVVQWRDRVQGCEWWLFNGGTESEGVSGGCSVEGGVKEHIRQMEGLKGS